MLTHIVFILGGILLGINVLDNWDGQKDFFRKIEQKILPYNTVLGGILLISSVLNLVKGICLLQSIIGICAGLLLGYSYLIKIESIKPYIIKISKQLAPFKTIIGVGILAIGVLGLLGMRVLC